MSVLNENTIIGASAAGEYEIKQSLRFDDGRGSSLTRTPASASNRKTFTMSFWIKRGVGGFENVIRAYSAGNDYDAIQFTNDNQIRYFGHEDSTNVTCTTNALYRDSSSWYHFLISVDTTQSTSSNRIKIYANGVLQTLGTATYPSQNEDLRFNSAVEHEFSEGSLDAYLAEFNFIDGQALTPDSFGETGTYNEWKPIEYAGTYGTNGFYLPFKQDYSVEGFSTVTYEGKGVGQYIGGTGFSPSLTWFKARNQTYDHQLFDVIRGPLNRISSNSTSAESSMTNSLTAFNTDGFTLGDTAQVNLNNGEFVAWCWDMGGTTASNTNGTITSSVRANTTYGQSIVTYTGNGSDATVGTGLTQTPDLVITKRRTSATEWWIVWHSGFCDSDGDWIALNNSQAARINGEVMYDASGFTSSTFGVRGGATGVNVNGATQVSYCFHNVAGYSKFSTYTGNNNTTGPVVEVGFSPAFIMIKDITAGNTWVMLDNTRSPSNPNTSLLQPQESAAETLNYGGVDFNATGFQIKSTENGLNAAREYLYIAFADTREYAYWYDQSGNNNDWTSGGGLTESDVMVDSPTNNFSVMNVLDSEPSLPVSEGNTKIVANGGHKYIRGTFELPKTGKHYWEVMMNAADASSRLGIGIATASIALNDFPFGTAGTYGFYVGDASNNAYYKANGSSDVFSIANTLLDIFQIAYDADSSKIWFGHNNTFYDVDGSTDGNPSTGVNPTSSGVDSSLGFYPLTGAYSSGGLIANFGQDSSFAGNKTPQGNSDSNGIGDFYYQPPSGFLSLCTKSLPDVDVIPSEHFNAVLYTGNGADNHAISGVGFQPDFVWMKSRSASRSHALVDSVRGRGSILFSDSSGAQQVPAAANNDLVSFDTDGFTVGTPERAGSTNENNDTIVAWNWKAGGTASSNTNGSVTSQVSANVDAGISIATFTLPTTATTIGHGLSKAPELVIHKGQVSGSAWWTFHKDIGNTKALRLDGTTNSITSTNFWNNTDPTSTVVTIGANSGNNNSWMMYCFHSVDGYSRVGSFVGNGSETGGPFVYCGFKPKFLLVKRATDVGSWFLFDTERSPYNVMNAKLSAENTGAEESDTSWNIDFLSNGFKLRSPHVYMNSGSNTHIFIAIAENPFKHSNSR